MKIRVASNEQLSKPFFYEAGLKLKKHEIVFGKNEYADIESDIAVIELKIDEDLHQSLYKKGIYSFPDKEGQIIAHLKKQVGIMAQSGKDCHVVCCGNISMKDYKVLVSWSYQFGFHAHHCLTLAAAVEKCIKLATVGVKKQSRLIIKDIITASNMAGCISLAVEGCSLEFAEFLSDVYRLETFSDIVDKLSAPRIAALGRKHFNRYIPELTDKIMEKVG